MQIPGQIPGNLADFGRGRGVLFRPGPGPRSIPALREIGIRGHEVWHRYGHNTVPDKRKCNIFAVIVLDLLKSQMEYLTFQWGT